MDLKQFKGQAFTIPNILSYIRFALIPVFVVIFALAAENSRLYVTAAAVVIVSGATDLLDGFIARRCNQVTALGRVLDPFADKLTSITVAICLCFKEPFVLFLAILYCLKESAMILAGILLLQNGCGVPGSKWFGKVATFVFYLSMLILVAAPDAVAWQPFNYLLILVNMAIITFSFLSYIPIFWNLWNDRPNKVSDNQKND